MGTPLAAGKQVPIHLQAAEPPGAAAQHEEVQAAPAAAVHMGALLHCHFLLRPLASIPNHVQTLTVWFDLSPLYRSQSSFLPTDD